MTRRLSPRSSAAPTIRRSWSASTSHGGLQSNGVSENIQSRRAEFIRPPRHDEAPRANEFAPTDYRINVHRESRRAEFVRPRRHGEAPRANEFAPTDYRINWFIETIGSITASTSTST